MTRGKKGRAVQRGMVRNGGFKVNLPGPVGIGSPEQRAVQEDVPATRAVAQTAESAAVVSQPPSLVGNTKEPPGRLDPQWVVRETNVEQPPKPPKKHKKTNPK